MASKSKNSYPVPAIDKNWQAEDDLRTMQRACEIRKDKSRMAVVKKLAKEKLEELREISGKQDKNEYKEGE